jgi:hypothetical protein
MRRELTVIDGGLEPGESVLDKLRNRPEDFPEEVFQRVLRQYEDRLPKAEVADILHRRASWSEFAAELVEIIKNPDQSPGRGFGLDDL